MPYNYGTKSTINPPVPQPAQPKSTTNQPSTTNPDNQPTNHHTTIPITRTHPTTMSHINMDSNHSDNPQTITTVQPKTTALNLLPHHSPHIQIYNISNLAYIPSPTLCSTVCHFSSPTARLKQSYHCTYCVNTKAGFSNTDQPVSSEILHNTVSDHATPSQINHNTLPYLQMASNNKSMTSNGSWTTWANDLMNILPPGQNTATPTTSQL